MERDESTRSQDASTPGDSSSGSNQGDASKGESRCPHCMETIRLGANRCPHCGLFIDPRFPHVPLDEGTYRHARLLLLGEIKEEILKWAASWTAVIATVVTLIVTLGGFFFIQQIAETAVDEAVKPALADHIGGLENLSERVLTYEDDLTSVQRTLQQVEKMASRLNARSAAELEEKIYRVASRLGDPVPSLLLKSPSSVQGEKPAVLYQSNTEEIRFRWDWIGEKSQGRPLIYSFKIVSAEAPNTMAVFSRKTRFKSAMVSFNDIADALKLEHKPGGRFYWTVTAAAEDRSGKVFESQTGVFEYYKNARERIHATGKIRIGLTAQEAPPFVYQKEEGAKVVGYDIDVVTKILESMPDLLDWPKKVQPVYFHFDWLPLLNSLRTNQTDLIISSITRKAEREHDFGLCFTDPYYITNQALLVLTKSKEEMEIEKKIERAGDQKFDPRFRLVAQNGTTGLEAARKLGSGVAAILIEDNLNDVVNRVINQTADAAVLDWPIAVYEKNKRNSQMENRDGQQIKLDAIALNDGSEFAEEYAIAVRAGEKKLLAELNFALKGLKIQGQLKDLQNEYNLQNEYKLGEGAEESSLDRNAARATACVMNESNGF